MQIPRKILDSLWQWIKKHYVISFLAIIFSINYAVNKIIETPTINPNPKDSYIIKGRFPFDKGYDLKFTYKVQGKALWYDAMCKSYNYIEDRAGPYRTDFFWFFACGTGKLDYDLIITPIKTDQDHYEITIYRDYFLPDLVSWRIDDIFQEFYKKNELTGELLHVGGGAHEYSHLFLDEKYLLNPDSSGASSSAKKGLFRNIMNDVDTLYISNRVYILKSTIDEDSLYLYVKYNIPIFSAQPSSKVKVIDFWLKSEVIKK